ncbi:hypothetical protein H310_07639 [Aphanomyces invadans]|uniref:PX domain-containing protein n=1 Tax=Aphanomyces invadans TaxID=157072 RepID=A0A024U1Z8_9STRA|nr:hypothetical protein H310_07639 [Aphanomyces invadans]ETW00250.1 hypothetical protein H310_07639 [Aphanomyces invadans]|eukprot:XP_008871275.1 hypothetical protein H310_07639 [Aphanomyces invadans]
MFTTATKTTSADAIAASMSTMKICQGSKINIHEHDTWCNHTVRNPIVISVSDPETRGSYIKKYTTYVVRQDSHPVSVRRRFSDFAWLHATLSGRYIGMLIPSMPEKVVYKSDACIRSRMRGLTIFLNQVMRSPYLRQDASVVGFLHVADDVEWGHVKKSSSVLENAGVGHLKWMQCLMSSVIPEDPDKFLVGIKRDVDHVEKCCVDIAAGTKKLEERCAAQSKDLSELHLMFNQWKNIEFNACDDKHSELNAILSTTTATIAGWHDAQYHQPVIHGLILHEGIKYIAAQVKDFKDILKQRDAALAQYDKATRPPVAPPKATSYFPRYAAEPSVAEIQASANRHEHVATCITRALFFSEAKRIKSLKAQLLRDAMGPFACAEYHVSKRMATVWSNFMSAADISQQDMLAAAKAVLDSADAATDSPDNQIDSTT